MSEVAGPRCAAIVGPYLSGKTTLLESLLFATGKIHRKGSIKEGNTVGDAAKESRDHQMSTEPNVATTEYLGDPWTFLDCPGSIEFGQETRNALMVADTAIVVCEPVVDKAMTLAPVLKFLDDHQIPHLLFINKIDHAMHVSVRDVLAALQAASERPLVLRQVPILEDETVSGYVDLVSERAYKYKPGEASALIEIPSDVQDTEGEARQEMLESLSDFDDTLLEQLLEDKVPPTAEIYKYLTENLRSDQVVPVFLGSAENDGGIRRLLKALRHETPGPEAAAARGGAAEGSATGARVFKTYHLPHTGKLSVARIWTGEIKDGMTLNGGRISGLFKLTGQTHDKISKAGPGEVVAMGRMDDIHTGDYLTESGKSPGGVEAWPEPLTPMFAFAVEAERREDEVKLSGAITKLVEEDPSYSLEHNQDTRELLLWGQGEIHLQVAVERLESKYHLTVSRRPPQVPYKETIRKPVSQHSRHKKQSGGHGQFGDVKIDIKPLPRGSGFAFQDTVVGGRVPKQYIPAVERGVQDYLARGPLGFPVVDVSVTLTDGQYHAVDSSDQAFKTAGRMAMAEGLPKCAPVLLEPIYKVTISVPSEFTSKVNGLVSGRRGQILGFDAKPGWSAWDEVYVNMPHSEIHDLVIELRSLTQGVGTFGWEFDHLQELTGRLADQVVQERQTAAAQ